MRDMQSKTEAQALLKIETTPALSEALDQLNLHPDILLHHSTEWKTMLLIATLWPKSDTHKRHKIRHALSDPKHPLYPS